MHRLFALCCAALLAITVTVLPASKALAHDQIISSDPAHNQVLAAAPESITLTFNNQLLDVAGSSLIEVRNSAGDTVASGPAKLSGSTASYSFTDAQVYLPQGVYRVVWRVVSSDGHPIEGSFNFGVSQVTAEQLLQLPDGANLAAGAITDADLAAAHGITLEPATDTAPDKGDANTAENQARGANIVLISLAALGAAGLIATMLILWRRKRSPGTQ